MLTFYFYGGVAGYAGGRGGKIGDKGGCWGFYGREGFWHKKEEMLTHILFCGRLRIRTADPLLVRQTL